ncbi:glycosyltransferase family 2 protein [Azospirillum sp.]|uniref:glycosyltransferase family 2 protein n=1 Tax=Azospirillum sp. TaxID=34012 RepID=UPI002D54AD66|nr:glycosyltransferase family 2 protein [Azospirillum sp.]HYD64566.1 glycosyltransferase family 2 protein [Azospirillum sp.]
MKHAPTVTIVTPSFNQAAFLPATLASVAGQTYPHIEHLVRDGGSTDASVAILAATPLSSRRFTWRSERDGGQAAAINRAIGESTGQIIGWLNSDDLLTPKAVERAVAHFRSHPDHLMVYGQARWIDAKGCPVDCYPTRRPGPVERFRDGCFICQPTVFLRREAIARVGLLDASLFAAHDFDLWIRLFMAAPDRIGFIDVEQAQSRVHPMTKTASAWDRAAIEAMRVLHRHFGAAPPHWVLSAITECFDRHAADAEFDGRAWALRFLRKAFPLLDHGGVAEVKRHARTDRRLAVAGPGVMAVAITADGWGGRRTAVHLRPNGHGILVVQGRHAHPAGARECLSALHGPSLLSTLHLDGNEAFTWRIPLPCVPGGRSLERVDLVAGHTFTPALVEAGSTDRRELSVLIDKVYRAPGP